MEMHVSRRVYSAAEDTALVLTRHLVQFIKALQKAVFSILYWICMLNSPLKPMCSEKEKPAAAPGSVQASLNFPILERALEMRIFTLSHVIRRFLSLQESRVKDQYMACSEQIALTWHLAITAAILNK